MGLVRAITAPERRVAVAGLAFALLAAGGLVTKAGEAPPRPSPSAVAFTAAPSPSPPPPLPTPEPTAATLSAGPATGVAVTLRAAALRGVASSTAPVVSRVRAGILLPISAHRPGFYEVLTPCELRVWVAESDVRIERPAGAPRFPMAMRDATIVLDPGHGGTATGAVGPAGNPEKHANSAIVDKLVATLARAPEGSGAPRVIVTRTGDFDAGLAYRAAIANAVRAHAFMSVHNNAEPDGPADRPGTETYYQFRSTDSKRLAGIAYEEVLKALSGFAGVSWVGERDAGAKYRLSTGGGDYYGLLRRTSVPSTIVEVAFISNAPEEQLLQRDDVRQAVADALHRALVRYVTTVDPGSGFVEPYPREPGPSGVLPSRCIDPA